MEDTAKITEAQAREEMNVSSRPDISAAIKALNIPSDAVAFDTMLFLKDGSVREVWNGMDEEKKEYIFRLTLERYIRMNDRNADLMIANIKRMRTDIAIERAEKAKQAEAQKNEPVLPDA